MENLIVDSIGYLAAMLVLISFSMRTMQALRIVSIISNLFSMIYAFYTNTYSILFLQLSLLPLNLYKIYEMKRVIRLMKEAAQGNYDYQSLVHHMIKGRKEKGEYLFKVDDESDCVYIIKEGEVYLEELDITLRSGDIVGEISLFTKDSLRGASAIAKTDLDYYALKDNVLRHLYYQNPDFGIYLTKLMIERLQSQKM